MSCITYIGSSANRVDADEMPQNVEPVRSESDCRSSGFELDPNRVPYFHGD